MHKSSVSESPIRSYLRFTIPAIVIEDITHVTLLRRSASGLNSARGSFSNMRGSRNRLPICLLGRPIGARLARSRGELKLTNRSEFIISSNLTFIGWHFGCIKCSHLASTSGHLGGSMCAGAIPTSAMKKIKKWNLSGALFTVTQEALTSDDCV